MDKNDKELFFLSTLTGFLGALTFILGRSIERAQRQQQKAVEDARTRFHHEQQVDDEGGDL